MENLAKMSPRHVLGKIRALIESADLTQPVMSVMGIITKVECGDADNGAALRFIGNFRAINFVTKKEYSSNKLCLPSDIEEEMLFELFGDIAPLTRDIEFAIDIMVMPGSIFSYSFQSIKLMEIAPVDTMAALTKKVTKAKKAK